MLRSEKEVEKAISALMPRAEILNTQDDQRKARATVAARCRRSCSAARSRSAGARGDATPRAGTEGQWHNDVQTQRKFSDADSHLMKSDGHFIHGYNYQLAVDSDHPVIVALGVSNQAPDVEHLDPTVQRIASTPGALPVVLTTDAGYWSETNADFSADHGNAANIVIGLLPYGQPLSLKRGPMPRDADLKARMARKLRSKAGSRVYPQRKVIVEAVNSQIKEARGLRRFLLRGLEKAESEWCLIAAPHSLLMLFRYKRSQQQRLALVAVMATRADLLGSSEHRVTSSRRGHFGLATAFVRSPAMPFQPDCRQTTGLNHPRSSKTASLRHGNAAPLHSTALKGGDHSQPLRVVADGAAQGTGGPGERLPLGPSWPIRNRPIRHRVHRELCDRAAGTRHSW